ncbi:MAG: signal peptide peptidase SppA [Acidobacteriota bacterium]
MSYPPENYQNQPRRHRWGLWILIAVVAIVIIGALLVMAGVAAMLKGSAPVVRPDSTLVLQLDRPIVEPPPDPIATQLFGAKMYQMLNLHQAIRRAAKDSRIKSLLIEPGMAPMGFGQMEQLRSDIEFFKKSGKPVYAYFEATGNSGYYLASTANKIVAPPTANLMITGLYAEVPFLRGAFDKFHIQPQFYHIGKYKSYSDMFMRKDMSDAQREAMNAILDSLYAQLKSGIAAGRNLPEKVVEDDINKGFLFGKDLKARGLVDEIGYFDSVRSQLGKVNGTPGDWRYATMSDYEQDHRAGLASGAKSTIGVVIASGDIVSGEGDGVKKSTIGSDTVIRWLKKMGRDRSVKAVVLRVNSPGGSALASDMMWHEVRLLKQKKPVIVSMGDVAASGGYYLSMGADAIVAEPGTITGSIGVVTGKIVIKGIWDWLGVNHVVMTRGKNANLFSTVQTFSPEQEELIQKEMHQFYDTFVSKAAEGRHMTFDQVDKIGRGRVWTGEQALKNGLVDKLGGIQTAIDLAKQKAGIPASQPVRLKVYPQTKTLIEAFLNSSKDDIDAAWARANVPPAMRQALLGCDV